MKFTIFILFFEIIYLADLVKSDTKSILIDNEEYICSSSYDQNSEMKPNKNSTKTGCKYNSNNGYNFFFGEKFSGYYKYHREPKIWMDAKEQCEAECAYLAIPNSKEEAEFLMSLHNAYPAVSTHNKYVVFIGLNDIVKEGQYVTVFGAHLNTTGFTNWHPDQPDNSGNEDCGSLYNGLLNDYLCNVPITFICEKDKV